MNVSSFYFQNLKNKVNEDFYLISEKYPVFSVADGVSRLKNPDGSYLKLSGARLAAEEFCKTTIDYLEKNYKKINLTILRKSLNLANKSIFNLNEKYGINKKIDYLVNDYFCTCGVACFIKENILYYGYAGDCGIMIYDKNDFLKLIAINDVVPLEEWLKNQNFKSEKKHWITWRKILRNKPKATYLTYGVFTGEKEAEHYYHLGQIKIQRGDIVFLYSDGFLRFISQPEFVNLFRKYKNNELLKRVELFVKKEIKLKSESLFDDKTLVSILI